MNTLLVSLDGSPLAAQALPLATTIAHSAKFELALLRVIELFPVHYASIGAAMDAPQLVIQLRRNNTVSAEHSIGVITMKRTLLFILVAFIVGMPVYGTYHWNKGTQALRARLEEARRPVQPKHVAWAELDGLPAPVQRYFRTVLKEGQPLVVGVRLQHSGTFNMGATKDNWKPFTSEQQVITQRPGFDWNGRVAMLPFVPVRVHDAYVGGEGVLRASLLGLFPLVDMHGGGDVAQGELMRFLAEAAWYPTALLPSQGVQWQAVDEYSADATLQEGNVSLTLRFSFSQQGLIDRVQATARGRTVGDTVVPTPWQGRFWHYEERGGMLVPMQGEVAWLLPEGPNPYWRGEITDIAYEWAR